MTQGLRVGAEESLEALGDSIAEVAALLNAGKHTLLTKIRRFDAEGAWGEQGARSMAHWLGWRIGLSLPAGREHVRVARALGGLPIIDEGLRRGLLSYSKVRAMIRVATPENEALLVNLARAATARQLEKTCRGVQRCTRAGSGDTVEEPYLNVGSQEDGTLLLKGVLPPEVGALVKKAFEAAKRDVTQSRRPKAEAQIEDGDCSKVEQKSDSAESQDCAKMEPNSDSAESLCDPTPRFTNVDALCALASTYLGTKPNPGSTPGRYEILVHVDVETLAGRSQATDAQATDALATDAQASKLPLCRLDGGQAISMETARRLACDAPRVVVLVDRFGKTLDVGRRTRAISAALLRALWLRDGGCRFPGCTNVLFVEGHHIKHWAHGGKTKLSNLALLCRAHHCDLHENGFSLTVTPKGVLVFRDPKGRLIPDAPQPAPISEPAVPTLAAQVLADGIDIHPYTAIPAGDEGEPDYDAMISGLIEGARSGWDPLMPNPW